MAHQVICIYCKEKFDRDKEEYSQVASRRYAHAACSLAEARRIPNAAPSEIINPLDTVVCKYCKKSLNRKDADCKQISNGKYAHGNCIELETKRELTGKERLEQYVMKLFRDDFVSAKVQKQIKKYIEEFDYTYSGIQKALVYFYEVKGNSLEKAQGGIGIVPHIYQDAYRYYHNLWLIEQKNQCINVEEYVPKTIEIIIKPPEIQIKKRKLFTFLDEEELHG